MFNPKKNLTVLVIFVLCVSLPVLAELSNDNERVIQRYKQILQHKPIEGSTFDRLYQFYLEEQGIDAMIADYQAEAKAKPKDSNVQLILGHIYKRLGKEQETIQAYKRAVELAPKDYYPHLVLGQTYAMLRRYEEAIAALTQAAKLSEATQAANLEDLAAIYKVLGRAYFSRDQLNDAVAAWQKIAELDPQNIFARIELADVFREQELYPQAIAQHEAIIKLKQEDPYRVCLSMREIGKIQEEMSKYDDAVKSYDAAIAKTAPGNWLRKDLQQRIIGIYAHNGDWPGLIAYYRMKLQETPNDVELIGLLASAYIENEQIDEGLAQYRKGLELAPTDTNLRLRLVKSLRNAERLAEAAAEYETLIQQTPDEVGFYLELGELYMKIEQPEKARATYQRLPDDAGTRQMLAEIYAGHGWIEEATAAYEKAIELAPKDLDLIEYFGEFYFRQGNREKAIATWNRLVQGENAPVVETTGYAANYSRLAQLLYGKDFREEALAASRKAVELAPNEYRYREELAKRLMENKEYDAALSEYAQAAKLAPNEFFAEQMSEQMIEIYRQQGVLVEKMSELEAQPESFNQQKQLAKMYLKQGNFTYALEALARARKLKPDDVQVNRALVELYANQGRLDESIAIYTHLIKIDGGNAREYYADIARLQLRSMNFDGATEAAKQVIAHSPRNPEGYQLRAEIAKQAGNYADAAESLKQAIRLRPESTDIRAELADTYRQMGDYRQAIEQYWRCWELSDNLNNKLAFVKLLSDTYADMGRSREFEDKLRQMAKTEPSNIGPVLALAEWYRMQGDLPEARVQLACALEIDQENLDLLGQLVKINLDLGDMQEALVYQQRLVKVQPDASNQQRLGELLFDIGREQEAIQTWTKLLHAKNKDVDAEVKLASLLIRHGLLDEALSALDRAGEKATDAKTVYQIGASLVEMNEFERAMPHFQRVLSMKESPKSPPSGTTATTATQQTPYYYGPPELRLTEMRRFLLPQELVWQIQRQPYQGMGGQPWAPSNFEEAQAGALVQLVTIAQRQRKLEEVIAQFEAKAKASPKDFQILETLVKVYMLTQNVDKMKETIDRMVALSPKDATYQALQFTYSMQKLDYEMAKKRLDQMAQLSPESRLWYVSQYTVLLYQQGKKDEADKVLAELENAKVTDVQTGAMLIETLTQMGKIDAAEKLLTQIPPPTSQPTKSGAMGMPSPGVQLWWQYTSIYQSLANAYLRAGQFDKAVELFWNVLERTKPNVGSARRVASLAYSSVSYSGYTPLQSSFPSPNIYYDENRLRMLQQFFSQIWTQNQLPPLYAKLQAELGKASPPPGLPHQGGGSYEARVYPGLALSYCYWWEGQRKKAQEVLATLQTENPEDLTLKLNTAFISIQTGEHKRAMDLLDELAEKDSRNRQQYNDLIFQVAIQTGNAVKIRELMTKILNSPVHVRELQQFSRRLQENGLTSYAIAVAKKAMTLAMGQRDPNLLMQLSQQLEQLGRGQDAAILAERAMRFANQRDRYGQTMYPGYFQQASQLLRRSKVTQERKGQLVEAAEKNPNSFQAQINLATYYASVNQVDKAAKAYDKALSLRPKDSNTRQQYAQMLRNGGRHADAVTQYMILLKDNPNALGHNYWDVMETFFQAGKVNELVLLVKETISPSVGRSFGNDFADNVAQRCLENNNPKAAAEIYEKMLSVQPNNPYMYAQIASAYAAAGDREKAIQFLRSKLDSDATVTAQGLYGPVPMAFILSYAQVQMMLKLIELYKASGDIVTLKAEYESKLAKNPNDMSLTYFVALMKVDSGDIDGADPLVKQLIDTDTGVQSQRLNSLADAYRNAGDEERETRLLEQAVKKTDSQNPWETSQMYEKLGSAYAQKGDKEKAADIFRKMGSMQIMQYGGGGIWEERRIADLFMQHEMWDDAEVAYTEIINDFSAQQYERQESQRRLMEIKQRRAGLSTTTKLAEKTATMNTATQRALAQEYMNRNELTKAAELFKQITQAMPEDLGSQAQLAQIYSRQNKHDQAIAQWQALLEADPENTQYQDGLVNAYQAAGKIPEALALAQKYIESDPSGIPYTRLGRVYAAGDRVDDAINAYQKAIQLSPGDGRVYQEVAQLYLRKNDLESAEKAFQGAIQYTGQEWERRNIERQMIDLYRRQGKLEEMLDKAEKEGMLTFEMQTERARNYRNEGKLEKAVEAYKKAMDLTTQSWDKDNVSNELVQVYAQLGQDELAIELYENLALSSSSSGTSIYSSSTGFRVQFGADRARETLINAYRSQGKQVQLAGYFEERLKKEPENPAILEMVAEIYRTSGDHAKSAENYLRLCKAQPGNVRSFYYAAAEFTQNNQAEQAADLLKQGQVALSSSNRNQDMWFLGALGTICLEGKLYDAAIKLFEDAISQSGRYGGSGWERQQFYRVLGQSYLGAKRYEEAIRAYQQMANIATDDNARQEAQNAMRKAYKEGGLYEKLIEQRLKAVADNPSDPDAHYTLAQTYEWNEMYDEAIAEYEKISQIQPDNPQWYKTLGNLYQKPMEIKGSVSDSALSLDGDGDYVEITLSDALNNLTSQVTMEAWIKPTAFPSGWAPIFYKGDKRAPEFSNRSYTLWLTRDGSLHLASAPGNTVQITVDSPRLIKLDNWHHVTGVVDAKNGTMKIFIDGNEVASRDFGSEIRISHLPLRIGWTYEEEDSALASFAGQIDEVRIWSVARSQQEIRENMNVKLTGNEPFLVGYWRFDEATSPPSPLLKGEGGKVTDSSPNKNDGKLFGDAKIVRYDRPIFAQPAPEKLAKAIEVYSKAIELEPTSYELYPLLARTYLQLDKLSDAEQVYRRALDRAPDHRDAALRDLWGLYAGKEKKSEGIAVLEELAPQMSESPTLHELLGDAYKEAGNQEKANHAYTQWVELRQKEADRNGRAWDYRNLSQQLLDKGIMPEKALELAQRAAQLDASPDYARTLGRAYLQNGQLEKVKALIQSESDANARSELALMLAEHHKRHGELDAAWAVLRDAALGTKGPVERNAALRGLWKLYEDASRPSQANVVGKLAPSFALRDMEGKEVKLSDFKGKVVLLNFWATWCPPCVKEIPHFIALYEQYKNQGLEMVGISMDEAGVEGVKSFAEQHQINYPILLCEKPVAQLYGGISSLPTTFFIDREGRIQEQYVGYGEKAVFEAGIKMLLAGGSIRMKVDIAMYTDTTWWILKETADRIAEEIKRAVENQVKSIDFVSEAGLPHWIGQNTKDGEIDVIMLFGDFPHSIYPSGNVQPDGSPAELFLEDGNLFLNTADYIFWGAMRNGSGGLQNMMDSPELFIDIGQPGTLMNVTPLGRQFLPSLEGFVSTRPIPTNRMSHEWEVEASFADDGGANADPVVLRHKENNGRVAIFYQVVNDVLPRSAVISEFILNWLPTVTGASVLPSAGAKEGLVDIFPHGSISGVVLDAESKTPIPGVKIEVVKDGFSFGLFTASDNEGKYTLDGVPVGNFDVIASGFPYLKTTTQVLMKPGEMTSNVDFEMKPILSSDAQGWQKQPPH